MKATKTFMMTAAAVMLSTAAYAEGNYGARADINKRSADQMGLSSDSDVNVDNGTYSDINPAAGNADASIQANTTFSASELDRQTVRDIQTSLANEGYSVRADGVWGPKTASALRQFQQANGLTASGVVDSKTLAALNVNTGM